MARRLLQVVVAAAAVMAVAVLARPSEPRAPEPFEIERETPSPTPSPSPSPTLPAFEESTPEPEPAGDEATPGADAARGPRAVLYSFDPRALLPLAEPVGLELSRPGAVQSDVSPDGRHLVVLNEPATMSGTGLLRLYDTGRLHEPYRVFEGPPGVTFPRFSPDSDHVVWMDFSTQGEVGIGGLRLDGDGAAEPLHDVTLPADLVHHRVTPLDGGRVGVHGYAYPPEGEGEGGGSPGPPPNGPVRLLVADLTSGRIDVDAVLPTADGSLRLEGEQGAWRERRAGVAWAPAGDRAYVAHADRDAVLVVDLGAGEVLTELAAASPALMAAGASETRWREATLGEGGDLLYVHGTAVELPVTSGDHQPGPGERELPVLVLDLAAGRVTHTVEARGRVLAASPGGEHVALAANLPGGDEPQMLRLHDGRSLEPRWERPVGFALDAAFLPGERHLLLFSVDDLGGIRHPGNGWAVGEGRGRLDVVDLSDGELVHTLRFQGEWWNVHLQAGIVIGIHYDG